MEELLEELRQLKRFDDDDDELLQLVRISLEESVKGSESEELSEEEIDALLQNPFAQLDLIGRGLTNQSKEFQEQTREFAAKLIMKFLEGSMGKTHDLPIYKSVKVNTSEEMFEIDVESTVERYLDHPYEELQPWTFSRKKSRNPVVLLIDTSFSMNGQKLLIAAMVVATLGKLIPANDLCIVKFANKPEFVKQFEEDVMGHSLLMRILQLRPRGYTDLQQALAFGNRLVNPYVPHSKLILLSDADPTMGKNPLPEAGKIQQLDVLLFPHGNRWLGQRLAKEALRGNVQQLNKVNDVPEVLKLIFNTTQ